MGNDITATQLYQQVNDTHTALIKRVLPDLVKGTVKFLTQIESNATVWPGRRPDDGLINENGSVHDAERLVRAVTQPYPGAFYFDANGRKIIV
jgi:methionyl-tRNA formyltransferase